MKAFYLALGFLAINTVYAAEISEALLKDYNDLVTLNEKLRSKDEEVTTLDSKIDRDLNHEPTIMASDEDAVRLGKLIIQSKVLKKSVEDKLTHIQKTYSNEELVELYSELKTELDYMVAKHSSWSTRLVNRLQTRSANGKTAVDNETKAMIESLQKLGKKINSLSVATGQILYTSKDAAKAKVLKAASESSPEKAHKKLEGFVDDVVEWDHPGNRKTDTDKGLKD